MSVRNHLRKHVGGLLLLLLPRAIPHPPPLECALLVDEVVRVEGRQAVNGQLPPHPIRFVLIVLRLRKVPFPAELLVQLPELHPNGLHLVNRNEHLALDLLLLGQESRQLLLQLNEAQVPWGRRWQVVELALQRTHMVLLPLNLLIQGFDFRLQLGGFLAELVDLLPEAIIDTFSRRQVLFESLELAPVIGAVLGVPLVEQRLHTSRLGLCLCELRRPLLEELALELRDAC
mmetsp:Transcript_10063/g.29243  ORF Transcript_10063/g.29243 Transcript_10063/m.29243 type:complete len:231 (+) Transcript_10063:1660-2352(+)